MSANNPSRRRPFIGALSAASGFALLGVLLAVASSNGFYSYLHPSPKQDASLSSCTCSRHGVSSTSVASFSGVIEDCCCDYETVDSLNADVVHPLLQRLVRTSFFRYFKVKLWCDCPHWPDDGLCRLRDCSVCECQDDEFPDVFKARPQDTGRSSVQDQPGQDVVAVHAGKASLSDRNGMRYRLPVDSLLCQEGKPASAVDRTLDTAHATQLWIDIRDNPWTFDDETNEDGISYVNLLLNPERFTGYTGASAQRIWDAIYQDNIETLSTQENAQEPLENRVIYRLISGLHSSISIHIAADYLLNERANVWGPNEALLHERVLRHPSRVRNLYFAYLFVLRAVTKAADYLHQADYDTGSAIGSTEGAESTGALMLELLNNERMKEACPKPFDEVQLWRGAEGGNLLLQVQRQFRNISSIMDCVGCEKCRLWGKLQILGLGTALEILFSHRDDASESTDGSDTLHLHRNEVIALINLLNKLSESIHLLHHFELSTSAGSSSHNLSHLLG